MDFNSEGWERPKESLIVPSDLVGTARLLYLLYHNSRAARPHSELSKLSLEWQMMMDEEDQLQLMCNQPQQGLVITHTM